MLGVSFAQLFKNQASAIPNFSQHEIFTVPGIYLRKVPAGVSFLQWYGVGSQGGGGGGWNFISGSGGAGGGGASFETAPVAVVPGDIVTITIPAGGLHGAGDPGHTNGQDGGSTTIEIGATTFTALGGKGGKVAAAGVGGQGGAGGQTSLGGNQGTGGLPGALAGQPGTAATLTMAAGFKESGGGGGGGGLNGGGPFLGGDGGPSALDAFGGIPTPGDTFNTGQGGLAGGQGSIFSWGPTPQAPLAGSGGRTGNNGVQGAPGSAGVELS